MALGVFGDVAQQEPHRHLDALAAHVAGFAVVEVFEHAELGLHAFKDRGDAGEEIFAVSGSLGFVLQRGELVFRELAAEGVGPEAVHRSGNVAEVEGDAGVGFGRGPFADIGEGVIQGAGQEPADWVQIGVFARQPRFHKFRISYGTNSTETSSRVAWM